MDRTTTVRALWRKRSLVDACIDSLASGCDAQVLDPRHVPRLGASGTKSLCIDDCGWRLIGNAVVLQLEVLLDKGLSDTQHKEIKQILAQQIEENMGMPMIYTLCEAIREYLVENNQTGQVRVLANWSTGGSNN